MHIAINQVNTVYYNLRGGNNEPLDSTYDDDKPLVYLHGSGHQFLSYA